MGEREQSFLIRNRPIHDPYTLVILNNCSTIKKYTIYKTEALDLVQIKTRQEDKKIKKLTNLGVTVLQPQIYIYQDG